VLWLAILKISGNRFGYDKTPTALTKELIESGIAIHFEDSIDMIPKDYFIENTLVIITPAVPKRILNGTIL
jgi:UDP-N-acetylmuramate--alanine ligase